MNNKKKIKKQKQKQKNKKLFAQAGLELRSSQTEISGSSQHT
jgi:hypothetical protein